MSDLGISDLLHPRLERAAQRFSEGSFGLAVQLAYAALYRYVNEAARSQDGIEIARAFHPDTGPLSDMSQISMGRDAVMKLFARKRARLVIQ